MLNRLDQMRHKLGRILRRREMAQVRHRLVHGTRDLVRRLLRHVGCVGPVVLARQHVHGAVLRVDGCDARAAVPAAEVEVEVAVEDLGDVRGGREKGDEGRDVRRRLGRCRGAR